MRDKQTLSVYAEKARDYATATDDWNINDPLLDQFIEAMPKGAEVLDLGCGPGIAAARMADAGLHVTAFDPVPQMVALAGRHPGVTAQEAGFDDVSGFDMYDGIWANFSLLHAARQDMPGHLSRIAEALKPGGRFHLAVKQGTGEGRDGFGRFYTYYTEEDLSRLVEDTGLAIVDRAEGRAKSLSGKVEPWFALVARG